MKKGDLVKVVGNEGWGIDPHKTYELGEKTTSGVWYVKSDRGVPVAVGERSITVIAKNEPNPAYEKQNGVGYMESAFEVEDHVNHPDHYTQGSIECIEAIRAELTPEEYRGYLKGNITKYVWRERTKGGTESLKKAQWYLNELIRFDG